MCDTWLQQAKIISLTLAKGLIKAFLKKNYVPNFITDNVKCQMSMLPIMCGVRQKPE